MAKRGWYYVRYMDDILVRAPTRWTLRQTVREVNQALGALGLEKAPGKTFIGRIAKDGLPCPAAVHHMIDPARILNAERSGHPASLPRSR